MTQFENSKQGLHEPPDVIMKQCHFIFSIFIICMTQLMCKWQTKVLLGPIAPLLQDLMPPPQPRELVGAWNIAN